MTKILSLFLVALFAAIGATMQFVPHADAAVNYNRLIDDSVFNSSSKMTAAQINSFLNSLPNSCISTNKGFKARDPIGYNPTDGFLYGSNVSAGRVIYDAAKAYDLNPQVLLVTLQKEQGYVSGPGFYDCTNPLSSSAKKGYTQAMGYGCPDGGTTHNYNGTNLYTIGSTTVTAVAGTCVNAKSKAGFSQQIIHAAWLLKFGQQRSLGNTSWAIVRGNWDNSDDPDSCYGGPMTQGYRKRCSSDHAATYFDGYTTIDSSSVHMDTGATASLYWYTPHKHGNLNFFNYFSSWFGNPAADTSKDGAKVGDWNGDGKSTPAVKRGNTYYFDNNNDGAEDTVFGIGKITDRVISGDWDGDGKDSIGLKRGNLYFLLNEAGNVYKDFGIGRTTDGAVVGDWDGDGKDSIGLKRGAYYYLLNADGAVAYFFGMGNATDKTIAGNWDGLSGDSIGLKRGSSYYLDNNNDGHADKSFVYTY
jgi:hypothetical protein